MIKRRVMYILFIIILLVLANISLYFYIFFDNVRKNNDYMTSLVLNEKSSVTYNMETEDKKYYNSKNLDEYNVNSINNIDTFFNYNLTFDKTVEGDYSYYVRGLLFDSASEMKEIYRSNDNKLKLDNKNVILINQLQNINIKDIIKNNSEMSKYNDAIIKYEMVITYHVYNKDINKFISNSKTIEIDIPITSGKYLVVSPSEEKNYKEYSNTIKKDNNTYLLVCMEFLGSVLLYILCIAYLIERMNPSEDIFDSELEKLLKKYKKYIVKLTFLPDLSYKDITFVEDVDTLVKISLKLHIPIDYVEILKHKESIFAVIHDEEAFVYKVSIKKRK